MSSWPSAKASHIRENPRMIREIIVMREASLAGYWDVIAECAITPSLVALFADPPARYSHKLRSVPYFVVALLLESAGTVECFVIALGNERFCANDFALSINRINPINC